MYWVESNRLAPSYQISALERIIVAVSDGAVGDGSGHIAVVVAHVVAAAVVALILPVAILVTAATIL